MRLERYGVAVGENSGSPREVAVCERGLGCGRGKKVEFGRFRAGMAVTLRSEGVAGGTFATGTR